MTESFHGSLNDTELGLAVESMVDLAYVDLHTRLLAMADSWHVSDARMAEALGRVATPEQHWLREVAVEHGVCDAAATKDEELAVIDGGTGVVLNPDDLWLIDLSALDDGTRHAIADEGDNDWAADIAEKQGMHIDLSANKTALRHARDYTATVTDDTD